MNIHFTAPEVFYLFIPLGLLVLWWTIFRNPDQPRGRALLSAGLRIIIIGILLLYMASPYRTYREETSLHRYYVIDVSLSIPDRHYRNLLNTIQRNVSNQMKSGDTADLYVLSDELKHLSTYSNGQWSPKRNLLPETPDDDSFPFSRSARGNSNLSKLYDLRNYESNHSTPDEIVVFTDGHDTSRQHSSRDVQLPDTVDFIPLPVPAGDRPDVNIRSVETTPRPKFHRPFRVSALLESNGVREATLQLRFNQQTVEQQSITFDQDGTHYTSFPPIQPSDHLETRPEKPVQFKVQLKVPEENSFRRESRTRTETVTFYPPPRVYTLSSAPEPLKPVTEALNKQHINTVNIPPDHHEINGTPSFPPPSPETESRKRPPETLVLLHRPVPDFIPSKLQQKLIDYVFQGGGILIFTGSASRNRTWLRQTDLESILPISAEETNPITRSDPGNSSDNQDDPKSKSRDDQQDQPEPDQNEAPPPDPSSEGETREGTVRSTGILLVVDKSGSMAGKKMDLVREAAVATMDTLSPEDMIGVLAFDGEPRWITKPIFADRIDLFQNRIRRLIAGGGTNIHKALLEAHRTIDEFETGIKHIILLSDGHSPPANFKRLVRQFRIRNATISTISVGTSAADRLMSNIASWGNGMFHFVSNFDEIPQIFTMESRRVQPEKEPREDQQGEAPETDEPDDKNVTRTDENNESQQPETNTSEDEPPEQTNQERTSSSESDKASPKKNNHTNVVLSEHVPFLRGFFDQTFPPANSVLRTRANDDVIVPLRMETETGLPFLAYNFRGTGHVASITSSFDAEETPWSNWKHYPQFLSRLVRRFASSPENRAHPTPTSRSFRNEFLVSGLDRTFFSESTLRNASQQAGVQNQPLKTLSPTDYGTIIPAPSRPEQQKTKELPEGPLGLILLLFLLDIVLQRSRKRRN